MTRHADLSCIPALVGCGISNYWWAFQPQRNISSVYGRKQSTTSSKLHIPKFGVFLVHGFIRGCWSSKHQKPLSHTGFFLFWIVVSIICSCFVMEMMQVFFLFLAEHLVDQAKCELCGVSYVTGVTSSFVFQESPAGWTVSWGDLCWRCDEWLVSICCLSFMRHWECGVARQPHSSSWLQGLRGSEKYKMLNTEVNRKKKMNNMFTEERKWVFAHVEWRKAELPVGVRHVRDDAQMTEKRVEREKKRGARMKAASSSYSQTSKQTHGCSLRALGRSQEHRLVTRWCCMSQPKQSNQDTWKHNAWAPLFPLI